MLGFLGAEFRSAVQARRELRAGSRPRALVVSERPRRHLARARWRTSRSSPRCTAPTSASRGPSPFRAPAFRHVMHHSTAVTAVSRWLAAEAQQVVSAPAPIVAPMPVAAELFSPGGPRDREPPAVRRPAQQAEGNRAPASRAEPHPGHDRFSSTSSATARTATTLQALARRARHRRPRALARRACRSPSSPTSIARRRRSSFRRSAKGSASSPSKRSCARRRSSRSTPAACPTSCSTIAPGILVQRRRRRSARRRAGLAARA